MKIVKITALVWVALGLGAVAQAREVENLYGFLVDHEGITYQVYSGGCTSLDDFQVEQLETHPVQLKLVRLVPDPCDAFLPYGVGFTVTWEELGFPSDTEFVVANPIQTRHRVYR